MWEDGRSWISLMIGVLLVILGGIPLFNDYIGFNLPSFMQGVIGQVAIYIIAVAGLFLVIDMFLEWGEDWAWISMMCGSLFLALGMIIILNQFNIITFGGFLKGYITSMVYNIIFIIEGIALAIGAFFMT